MASLDKASAVADCTCAVRNAFAFNLTQEQTSRAGIALKMGAAAVGINARLTPVLGSQKLVTIFLIVMASCFFVSAAANPAGANTRDGATYHSKKLILNPMASTRSDETHAALVISQQDFNDVSFSADVETIEQLRQNNPPNAWESAWVVFNYSNNSQFYYVAFKPGGWELGKVDPAYPGAQRYLATGTDIAFPVGTAHRFEIKTNGAQITVMLNGKLLTTFTDTERPYLGGRIGFYTEDAKAAFDNVTGSITENFESYSPQSLGDNGTLGSVWMAPFVGFGSAAIESVGSGPHSATAPSPSAPKTPSADTGPAPSPAPNPARAPRIRRPLRQRRQRGISNDRYRRFLRARQ